MAEEVGFEPTVGWIVPTPIFRTGIIIGSWWLLSGSGHVAERLPIAATLSF